MRFQKDFGEDNKYADFNKSADRVNSTPETRPGAFRKICTYGMVYSQFDGRIYGALVDQETGHLQVGLVNVAETGWETASDISIVPEAHYGHIQNPSITIDPLGHFCVCYEYAPTDGDIEIWVYDQRYLNEVVVDYIQKITEGVCPYAVTDRDDDIMVFYKRTSDGKLCWRSRSQAPYIYVWDTENIINVTEIDETYAYIDAVWLSGSSEESEAQCIIVCVSLFDSEGNCSLYYLKSSNWPRTLDTIIVGNLHNNIEITAIDWQINYLYTIPNYLLTEVKISGISYKVIPIYVVDNLMKCEVSMTDISIIVETTYNISNAVLASFELRSITWTSVNVADILSGEMELSCQITGLSLTTV